jgi:hypothetical protein
MILTQDGKSRKSRNFILQNLSSPLECPYTYVLDQFGVPDCDPVLYIGVPGSAEV